MEHGQHRGCADTGAQHDDWSVAWFQREAATQRTRVQNVANPDLSVDISSGRAMGRLYARILDAGSGGRVDPCTSGLLSKRDAERARRVYDTHLSRALWMTRDGFADLLRSGYH